MLALCFSSFALRPFPPYERRRNTSSPGGQRFSFILKDLILDENFIIKSLAIFVLLAFPYISYSQNIDFPDPNFKEALIKEGVDSNADGEISIEEAAVVDTLYISGAELSNELRINNLIGINYFTNLIHLDCFSNNLSSLELDGLTSLKHLFCQYNKLTSINFSNLLLLERLFCDHNFLTILNIENCLH